MQTLTLDIHGMTCEACVHHVAKALNGLDGVQSAEVSLPENRAVVRYDPEKVSIAHMQDAVEEEGYDAKAALDT